MDPIKYGNIIFKNISTRFNNEPITNINEIENFFSLLISETKGLVIMDFLDTSNWDSIESFKVDKETGILTLIWHDYREVMEDEEEKELRQMAFPASAYSLCIAVKSIIPISIEQSSFFLLNGYSKTEKEIKTLYKNGADEIKIFDNSFFEKRVARFFGKHIELSDFHCTPIFSLAILPKNCGLRSFESKKLLYWYNIQDALKRLFSVIEALDNADMKDLDLICEKVNTARRIFEFVLKIECCFREIKLKENYSQILLGDLLSYVKKSRNDEISKIFGKMAELLNEFSHDSGKAIDISKAKTVCMLVMSYTRLIQLELR